MREQQFLRFVQQICYLLKLSQPCSKTALQYFLQFKQYQNHNFDQQILIAACIYLSVKIFEQEVRIRDILNMIYVLTSLYKLSQQQTIQDQQLVQKIKQHDKQKQIKQKQKQKINNEHKHQMIEQNEIKQVFKQQLEQQLIVNQNQNQSIKTQTYQQQKQKKQINKQIDQQSHQHQYEQEPYILLKNIQKLQNLTQIIQPRYSLSDYNQYKGKIIQAQQTLLRILGFSFSLSQQNKKQLKRLLITIHYMRIPSTIAETIIKVYNDIHYIDVKYWPQGIIYFSYLIVKLFIQNKQQPITNLPNIINLQLKQGQSKTSHHKVNDKQAVQINRIKQFISLMSQQKKWQELLCTNIKDLQHYSQKLTIFYSGIHIHC